MSDITLGTSHGVRVPASSSASADVHTHSGLSGTLRYVKGSLQTGGGQGDYALNWQNRTNGYVYRAGGGAWRFDYEAFRNSYVQAKGAGLDTYAEWHTRKIR